MAKFSSRSEVEARKAFIAGSEQTSIWDMDELKKLTLDELVDRMETINHQYTLMTWKICLRIREHFKSDKLMGQFLNELREKNPYHPLSLSSQQILNRRVQAARFCERMRIDNIHKTGLDKTGIYYLAAPRNAAVAGKVYTEIKRMKLADRGEKLSNDDVLRMIEQARSITVNPIEHEPIEHEPTVQEPTVQEPVRVIEVKNNIAQIPEVLEQIPEPSMQYSQPTLELPEPATIPVYHQPTLQGFELTEEGEPDDLEADIRLDNAVRRRKVLLDELFSLEAYYLTDEQAIEELISLAKTHRPSAIKRIPLYQGAIAGDRMTYPGR
jgi:hypothetical protein